MTHPMTPFTLWARYNRQMNRRVYDTCAALTEAEWAEDRGAFFGSVQRTLNHILIADAYWLRRLDRRADRFVFQDEAGEPLPIEGADQVLYAALAVLSGWRDRLDEQIVQCVEHLQHDAVDLEWRLTHRLPDGREVRFSLTQALCHWFNHQTHHRGQVTTLLTQMGHDVGVTDLLLFDLGS